MSEQVCESGRPHVVLDQPGLDGVPVVGIDDAAGTALATRHLLDLGHRRLAVVSTALRPDGYQGLADDQRQRWATYSSPTAGWTACDER